MEWKAILTQHCVQGPRQPPYLDYMSLLFMSKARFQKAQNEKKGFV